MNGDEGYKGRGKKMGLVEEGRDEEVENGMGTSKRESGTGR